MALELPMSPHEMQQAMGLGISLGNVMETPIEGLYAKPVLPMHLDMFSKAGFQHVRIPVCWGHHMALEHPYSIKAAFLDRVEELVNQSLARGLITVITAHHEWWIDFQEDDGDPDYLNAFCFKALPRFEALWDQVAERFKSYGQLLLFAILNEPHKLSVASLNELHRVALSAIRRHNATRISLISGKDFANPKWILKHPKALLVPPDPMIMLDVHVTEPHGVRYEHWDIEEVKRKMKEWVDGIEIWGRSHGLPIYVGEFGCCSDKHHEKGRLEWLATSWSTMKKKGFSACLWDDGDEYTIYDREHGTWDHDALIILQQALPGMENVSMEVTSVGEGGHIEDSFTDMLRAIEHSFVRLHRELEDVSDLPEVPELDVKEDHKDFGG